MYKQENRRKRQRLPSLNEIFPSPPLTAYLPYCKSEYTLPFITSSYLDLTDNVINDNQVLEDASFFFFGQITPFASSSTPIVHNKKKRDFILIDSYHEPSTKQKLIPDLIQSRK